MVEIKQWTKTWENIASLGTFVVAAMAYGKTTDPDTKHPRSWSNMTILLILIAVVFLFMARAKGMKKSGATKAYKTWSILFMVIMSVLCVVIPGGWYAYKHSKKKNELDDVEINHPGSALYFMVVGAIATMLNMLTLDN